MDKPETVKIFDLLQQFYPQAAALKDKKKRYAWRLALEPYAFEDVKAAVLSYARKGKFFPDLSDITSGLLQEGRAEAQGQAMDHYHTPEYEAQIDKYLNW